MIIKAKYCPNCGSTRLDQLTILTEFHCRRCQKKFRIEEIAIQNCSKCDRPLPDLSAAVLLGNNKHKCAPRCRRIRSQQ